MEFEWDDRKAKQNLIKHKVNFDEAKSVFCDIFAIDYFDEAHSKKEHRNLLLGYSINNRILLVSFIEKNEIIRIISARKASKDERKQYERRCN